MSITLIVISMSVLITATTQERLNLTIDDIEGMQRDYSSLAGDDLIIRVPVIGDEPPNSFKLMQGAKESTYLKEVTIDNITAQESIVNVKFMDTAPQDTGQFTLVMSNAAGENVSFDFRVTIKTVPLRLQEPNHLNVTVDLHSHVIINITIIGTPLPVEFSLYKDGRDLAAYRDMYSMTFVKHNVTKGTLRLKIKTMAHNYAGVYKVRITNEIGNSVWYIFTLLAPEAQKAYQRQASYITGTVTVLMCLAVLVVMAGIISLLMKSRRMREQSNDIVYEYSDRVLEEDIFSEIDFDDKFDENNGYIFNSSHSGHHADDSENPDKQDVEMEKQQGTDDINEEGGNNTD